MNKTRRWEFNRFLGLVSEATGAQPVTATINNTVINMRNLDTSGNYKLPVDAEKFPQACDLMELVDWYNEYSGSITQLKKFSNRAVAERRCAELKQAMDDLKQRVKPTARKINMAKAKTTKAKSKKTTTTRKSNGGGGRVSPVADYTVHKLVKDNPRREGTFGHKTWEKIKSGMTAAAIVAAGGRFKDLLWDKEHKHLEFRKPAKAGNNGKAKAKAKPETPKPDVALPA